MTLRSGAGRVAGGEVYRAVKNSSVVEGTQTTQIAHTLTHTNSCGGMEKQEDGEAESVDRARALWCCF